jgi:hypothetical protein
MAQANETLLLQRRVQSEYTECPGLNLTKPQMRRFLGVDEPTCSEIVEALIAAHFLARTDRGEYVIAHSPQ